MYTQRYISMGYLILAMAANVLLLEVMLKHSMVLTYKIVIIFLFLIVSSNLLARATNLLLLLTFKKL